MTAVQYAGIFSGGSTQQFTEDDIVNGVVVANVSIPTTTPYGTPYAVQAEADDIGDGYHANFTAAGYWILTARLKITGPLGKGLIRFQESESSDMAGEQDFEITDTGHQFWVSTSAVVKVGYAENRFIELEFETNSTTFGLNVDSVEFGAAYVGYSEE